MSSKRNPKLSSNPGAVRRANISDVPTLVELNEAVQELHASLYPADFKAHPDSAELTSFFSAMISADRHFFGLFEAAEGPIAYIWFEDVERSASAFMERSRILHIRHICVRRDARGQGVGSALMEWADQLARMRGISQVAVEHWADNETAHRFFSRRGFEPLKLVMRRPVAGFD